MVGQPEDAAIGILENAGFTVDSVSVPTSGAAPGTVFDHDFIRDYAFGFDEFIADLRRTTWDDVLVSSGVTREQIRALLKEGRPYKVAPIKMPRNTVSGLTPTVCSMMRGTST